MSVRIERVSEEMAALCVLIGELDAVLGANYQPHQRHGLSLVQLFEPQVRFFIVRLDGEAMGCGKVTLFDDYAEVKRMYTRPAARGRGLAKALLQRIEDEARECCGWKPGRYRVRRSGSIGSWASRDAGRSALTRRWHRGRSR